MRFGKYPQYCQPFLVMHYTGFGVMEAPFVDKGIVDSAFTYEMAEELAKEYKLSNNTDEEIKSTWYNNRYEVVVNQCTDEGELLFSKYSAEFEEKFEQLLKHVKEHPEEYHTVHELDGRTTYLKRIPEFDSPTNQTISLPGRPLESCRITILDLSK